MRGSWEALPTASLQHLAPGAQPRHVRIAYPPKRGDEGSLAAFGGLDRSVPRARGDDPIKAKTDEAQAKCSPRSRG
jgi:hypothetical protein